MRIVGGRARGIRLDAGDQEAVRPTTDRLKETLFNMLGSVEGEVMADIFAGSGALGLEALSRGASKVFFVESDKKTTSIIKTNLEKVQRSMGPDCGEAIFICADWRAGLRSIQEKIDLILADPPYANDSALARELLLSPELSALSHDESLLVVEHMSVSHIASNERWELIRQKHCTPTTFSFFKVQTQ